MKVFITFVLSLLVVGEVKADFIHRGIPIEADREIARLEAEGKRIKCVAFAPNGGWSILFDNNGYFNRNVPVEALRVMGDIAAKGEELKCVAFAPNGGWSILFGRSGSFNRNVPVEALRAMANRPSLVWVDYITDGWCLIYR